MITTKSEWFEPDEKLPDEDGEYFVFVHRSVGNTLEIVEFAKNLHEYSPLDFPEESDSRPGFFDVNCGRCHWYTEIPLKDILYWTNKIPKFEEEQ